MYVFQVPFQVAKLQMIAVSSTREIQGPGDSAPVPLHFPCTAGHLPMHLLPAASVPPSHGTGRAVPPPTSHDSSEELCDPGRGVVSS